MDTFQLKENAGNYARIGAREPGNPSTCVPDNMRPSLFLGLCHLLDTPSPNTPLQEMLTPNLDVTEALAPSITLA